MAPTNASSYRQLEIVSRNRFQKVQIVEGEFLTVDGGAWWGGLSRHESCTGLMKVEYPDCWEGTVEIVTRSGSAGATGKGTEMIRKERGRVIARKGE